MIGDSINRKESWIDNVGFSYWKAVFSYLDTLRGKGGFGGR